MAPSFSLEVIERPRDCFQNNLAILFDAPVFDILRIQPDLPEISGTASASDLRPGFLGDAEAADASSTAWISMFEQICARAGFPLACL